MQAMRHRQLVVMRPYPKLNERVDLDIAYVDLALIIIDEIYFNLVVHGLCLVDFYYLLLFEQTA